MRTRLIYLIAFSLLINSCKSALFVIKSKVGNPIEIEYNTSSKGYISSKDSIVIKAPLSSVLTINAINDKYSGGIVYAKKPSGIFSYSMVKSSNAIEYARKMTNYKESDIETYFVQFNQSTNNKEEVQLNQEFGHIKLTSNERDVEIYLDGNLIGKIEELPFNKKIASGDHQLMARKEFYMPITIKFKLNPQEVYGYNFELKPAKGWIEEQPGQASTVQARGNLTVVTELSDYKVFIEGVEKSPPFELKNMPAGIYKLKIVNPDQQHDLEITVDEGKTKYVDLDLLYQRKK